MIDELEQRIGEGRAVPAAGSDASSFSAGWTGVAVSATALIALPMREAFAARGEKRWQEIVQAMD